MADLDADEYRDGATGAWTCGLLVRRGLADGECAFFSTWCLASTPIETLVSVEGKRWAIEDAFETAKNELGLDHNETSEAVPRTLARLAPPRLAGDAGLRHAGARAPPRERGTAPKNNAEAAADALAFVRWSVQEIRRVATRLAQRRIQPAHVIAWSLWRRAHQAAARRSHLERRVQL